MVLQKGFTLAEVLVVLALIGFIGTFTVLSSFDGIRRSSLREDRQSLIAALEHARAEAVSDVCTGNECSTGADHGVSIQSGHYVIFQGAAYDSRDSSEDEILLVNPAFTHTGLSEIVFASSSGDALQTGTIIISDRSAASSTISVGDEGQISWSN